MSKITLQREWIYDDLQKIVVSNEMASLTVNATEGQKVELEGLLRVEEPDEEYEPGDSIHAEFKDGVLHLELEELEYAGEGFGRSSQIRLGIPEQVKLELSTENYPVSLLGLKNDLQISTENGPVSIEYCDGIKHIESENGPVRVIQSNGNLEAKLENGIFTAEGITGGEMNLESENGAIKVKEALFNSVDLETENGLIYYETKPQENGDFKFKTENGKVHLVLPYEFDFTLTAKTECGKVISKLDAKMEATDEEYTITSGTGSNKIEVETENGIIKITNDGHLNLDFIKDKMEQLKSALENAKTGEEKDKVMDLMNKVIEYLNKAVGSINEEKVKEKVNAAIIKLKTVGDGFDFDDTKRKVMVNIDEIGTQIQEGLKEGIKGVKEGIGEIRGKRFHEDVHEYIRKVMDSPLIKPYLGGELKNKEKEEVADRSRLKILEMLESGKITSEEAEKLLKAIGKE